MPFSESRKFELNCKWDIACNVQLLVVNHPTIVTDEERGTFFHNFSKVKIICDQGITVLDEKSTFLITERHIVEHFGCNFVHTLLMNAEGS